MPRGRPVAPIVLDVDEKNQLLSFARSHSLPHGIVRRAQIVPACAEGESNAAIASRMGLSNVTVGKWRRRYREHGIEGLHDEFRPGRPRTHEDERIAEVTNTALKLEPPNATRWSVRSMAEHTGVSKSTVQRWFGLITQQAIHRGSFSNVKELVHKINAFVEYYNARTSPFVWVATADSILAKIERLCSVVSGTRHWHQRRAVVAIPFFCNQTERDHSM